MDRTKIEEISQKLLNKTNDLLDVMVAQVRNDIN